MAEKIPEFHAGQESGLYQEECLSPEIIKKYTKKLDVSRLHRLKSASGSNGNQLKWMKDDLFIKADFLGYESLAEIMVCWLLKFVKNFYFDYVRYYPCTIYENGVFLKNGCYSINYLGDAEEVTIGSLLCDHFKSFGISYDDLRDFLLDETGIDVKNYLDAILCLDSITRNEDRHFYNFAFLYDGAYRLAPVFDNGYSCLSDLSAYPMNAEFEILIKNVRAKPFFTKFKDQIYFVERLLIDVQGFFSSIQCDGNVFFQRAVQTIRYGLDEMHGISWENI